MSPLFNRASAWIKTRFGRRVQKIPIDAGFSCPNRDGSLSGQGCLYCSNASFAPFYSNPQLAIAEQLRQGREYYQKRYGCSSFFAYFQSYSGTYAPVETLRQKYREAADCQDIEGLIIATRPDCINSDIVTLLQDIAQATFIRIELGVESFDDAVLAEMNRCHDVATSLQAISRLRSAEIPVCIHLISGLPGEKPDYMTRAARVTSESGADMVKLHHLQIIKGSRLARLYAASPDSYHLYSIEAYIDRVCEFVANLAPNIYLERFISRIPVDQLVAPIFSGIDESAFQRLLEARLKTLGLYQGSSILASLP
ncbi:MAG: TIGR01212 family radical SAM protein [Candidatus Riflebacteria bacterium HGW-Riflebacteria-2]|jgi:hypothetical protein|nr:MAG: TIGR01212 family radical SAM protein [Candidatus Riflebacteria bacterium HGW-Riflebacteria-2]